LNEVEYKPKKAVVQKKLGTGRFGGFVDKTMEYGLLIKPKDNLQGQRIL
jgi:hypothetical protein